MIKSNPAINIVFYCINCHNYCMRLFNKKGNFPSSVKDIYKLSCARCSFKQYAVTNQYAIGYNHKLNEEIKK